MAGRPKGVKNKRSMLSSIDSLKDRGLKIAERWLNDPDEFQAREGLKVLAPYLWAKKTEVSGAGGEPIKFTIGIEWKNV